MISGKNRLAASIATIVVLLGSIIASTIGIAQAVIIQPEDHWKYRVDRWVWDEDRRRTYGLITPQVVIQNETRDRLEGYIADANGTRLHMYEGDQIVMVQFLSEVGATSGWLMSGRVQDGYFGVDIPQRYREAETVRIYIGNYQYTVNDGTPTTPQTQVLINAGMLNYRTNSTLDQIEETQVTQVEEPVPVLGIYSGGSLIDYILSLNGFSPVRSPNSSK